MNNLQKYSQTNYDIFIGSDFMKKILSILLLLLIIFPTKPYAEEIENEKIIYLTFDDGPGAKVTENILDILKSENINATFFLIGDQIKDQEDLVKRINDEGNAIGLHSMSHSKNKLYSCNENFINEMFEEQILLENILQKKIFLLRFPFGCNNTNYHLKKSLVDDLHNKGFKIYDWNADSTDGANANAPVQTIVKRAKSDKDTIYLLMQCGFINKNSAKALPEIIKYYKDNGYTFKVITEDTPEIFHYIEK